MKIINLALLAEFRGSGPCGFCGRACQAREAAHIFSKGAGRLDIRENLIALGGPFECACHHKSHQGLPPSAADLIRKVAEREGTTPQAIWELVWRLRNAPKGQSHPDDQGGHGDDALRGSVPPVGQGDRLPGLEVEQDEGGWLNC